MEKTKELKRFYRVQPTDSNRFYVDDRKGLLDVIDMLADCSDGEGFVIRVVYMRQSEFDALPEFTGF